MWANKFPNEEIRQGDFQAIAPAPPEQQQQPIPVDPNVYDHFEETKSDPIEQPLVEGPQIFQMH